MLVGAGAGTAEFEPPPPPPQALRKTAAAQIQAGPRNGTCKRLMWRNFPGIALLIPDAAEKTMGSRELTIPVPRATVTTMRSVPVPAQAADTMTIWSEGEVLPDPTLALHALTHALHYGSSIFEGIRVYPTRSGAAIFRLREHVERLYEGAAVYGMTMPFDADAMFETIRSTVAASGRDSAYVRPLVYYAGATVRLAPETICETNVLVAVLPFAGLRPGQVQYSAGLTTVMKTPSAALPSHVKAGGHYTNSIRALHEVNRRGFDEAVLLNDRGEIAEGSGENIFVVRDGALLTNDKRADILPGITRDSVLTLAREAGLSVTIRPLTLDDLTGADEAFFTGTAAEVVPISRFESRAMTEGPITERLRTTYASIVRGEIPAPAAWLTLV